MARPVLARVRATIFYRRAPALPAPWTNPGTRPGDGLRPAAGQCSTAGIKARRLQAAGHPRLVAALVQPHPTLLGPSAAGPGALLPVTAYPQASEPRSNWPAASDFSQRLFFGGTALRCGERHPGFRRHATPGHGARPFAASPPAGHITETRRVEMPFNALFDQMPDDTVMCP